MNHLTYKPTSDSIVAEETIRYTKTEFGEDREILSNSICCSCEEKIWVSQPIGRMTINHTAFKVVDYRAYLGNVVPEYTKVSNVLLQCHWTCKEEFQNKLNDGTFTKR